MKTNIDKEYFNQRFAEYMTIHDRQIDNWFYTKYLHDQIRTIVHNVTYHFEFNTEQMLYEDVEADLLLHLQLKKDCFRKYKGDWYNIVFTSFKRKFYDLLRSYKVANDRIAALIEICNDHLTISTNEMEYEPQTAESNVLPITRLEASQGAQAAG